MTELSFTKAPGISHLKIKRFFFCFLLRQCLHLSTLIKYLQCLVGDERIKNSYSLCPKVYILEQCCSTEFYAVIESSIFMLSNTVATSHRQLVSTVNVPSSMKELNFFCNLNVKSHIC